MQWMGGARKFIPSDQLRSLIIETYVSGCSIQTTYLTYLERGFSLPKKLRCSNFT